MYIMIIVTKHKPKHFKRKSRRRKKWEKKTKLQPTNFNTFINISLSFFLRIIISTMIISQYDFFRTFFLPFLLLLSTQASPLRTITTICFYIYHTFIIFFQLLSTSKYNFFSFFSFHHYIFKPISYNPYNPYNHK